MLAPLALGLLLLAHPQDASETASVPGRFEAARRAAVEKAQRAAMRREAARVIVEELDRVAAEEVHARLVDERAQIEQDEKIEGEKAWLEARAGEKFRAGDILEKKRNPTGAAALYREVARTFRGTEAARLAEVRLAALSPSYPVVRVVDGDTIVLTMDGKPRTVRLVGVDAPEVLDPEKVAERLGKEASAFLGGLLRGRKVRLEYDPTGTRVDSLGRVIAYAYLPSGVLVNREIIARGYGIVYEKYPCRYLTDFRVAESEARAARVGLWAGEGTPSSGLLVPATVPADAGRR
jgi:endonuclease YncB( thermonuclease family)